MIPPAIPLRDFADPISLTMETNGQAKSVIRVIEPHPRRWIELDFSGISGVSWEFTLEFIRLVQLELSKIWLVPRHYDQSSAKLITPLVSRLERMRDEEWIEGCERFVTGTVSTKDP